MKTLVLGLCLASLAAAAGADERVARVPLLAKYEQECSGCHVAYPPSMLPASSWQRLMGSLPRHFGTDASIDPPTEREIARWLASNAGSGRRVVSADGPPEDRITRSAWFVREHREVAANVWQRATVRSAANCSACHPRAAQGAFDEHDIRIPK